jgi:hypothetical protein
MDTSPSQISEVEFEQLLAAASQTGRSNLHVLSGGRELPTLTSSDTLADDDSRRTPKE